MSVLTRTGVIANLEVTRASSTLFQVEVVLRNGERFLVTSPPTTRGLKGCPMYVLVCDELAASPGSSVSKAGVVGWRRKHDVTSAVAQAIRMYGDASNPPVLPVAPVARLDTDGSGLETPFPPDAELDEVGDEPADSIGSGKNPNWTRVWFRKDQLEALKKLVDLGADQLSALEVNSIVMSTTIDRVDCALRHAISRTRRRHRQPPPS